MYNRDCNGAPEAIRIERHGEDVLVASVHVPAKMVALTVGKTCVLITREEADELHHFLNCAAWDIGTGFPYMRKWRAEQAGGDDE